LYYNGNTASISGNTAVGQSALSNLTGNFNTAIGYNSGSSITSGSKNTILGSYNGNQGGLDIRTLNNYIVLSDGDGNPRAIWDNNGYLIMGATTVTGADTTQGIFLYSSAGVAQFNRTSNASLDVGRLTTTGNCAVWRYGGIVVGSVSVTASATAYNTTSDYRLKNSVAPMTGALAKVTALNPVTFKWNADDSDGEGFIAHELAEVCPYAVTGEKDAVDADGNPVHQGIDTSFLVATLTAAIKELKSELDTVKAELATLKGT
jgi:hypothetical protein